MPENIMKTLWDESDDLHDETMSTNSVLSDDYTDLFCVNCENLFPDSK